MFFQKLAKFWLQNVQYKLFSQKRPHRGIGNLVESIFLTFFTLEPNLQSEVFQKTKFTIPRRVHWTLHENPYLPRNDKYATVIIIQGVGEVGNGYSVLFPTREVLLEKDGDVGWLKIVWVSA